jgi:transposase-like protein
MAEEMKRWRERPQAEEDNAVFLDGTLLSVRRGTTAKEPVCLALGIRPDGRWGVLGFWMFGAEGESACNREEVLKDLRRQGVRRVWVLVTDDLPGLEEAIRKLFPEADGPLCVLHAVRQALSQIRRKDRPALAENFRKVDRAEPEAKAREALPELRERWGRVDSQVIARWESRADALRTFFHHPPPIRRYIYTTNQWERLAKEVQRHIKILKSFAVRRGPKSSSTWSSAI